MAGLVTFTKPPQKIRGALARPTSIKNSHGFTTI